jgi:molybdopterin converting factor small subunit
MKVELRFFASVREALGVANESVEVPDGIVNVGDVRAWLRTRGGAWAETLAAHGVQSRDDGPVAAHHRRLRSRVLPAGHGRLR